MTLQRVYEASVVALAFSVVAVGPAYAQRRDGNLLPQEQDGQVVAVGCLVRGDSVRGGQKDKYVLGRPKKGPVASVAEATCTVEAGADALMLDNPEKAKITDSMLGKWAEITGRLEKETSKNPDNLRELDVLSYKAVPVVIPPRAAATATPSAVQSASPAAAAAPRPAAPAAQAPAAQASAAPATPNRAAAPSLPKTASPVPAIGLTGLLLLAVSLVLRSFRLGQRA